MTLDILTNQAIILACTYIEHLINAYPLPSALQQKRLHNHFNYIADHKENTNIKAVF